MLALLLVLLLALVLLGIGAFAVKFLLIIGAILLALWLVGFLARGAEATWYRW
ncbi:MAG: hypothetical protein QOG06_1949 [Gaiellaceae bacterium]|jgi:hypothetical protein|nr:hypothetical protein [Gaiellaceae bacterium]